MFFVKVQIPSIGLRKWIAWNERLFVVNVKTEDELIKELKEILPAKDPEVEGEIIKREPKEGYFRIFFHYVAEGKTLEISEPTDHKIMSLLKF